MIWNANNELFCQQLSPLQMEEIVKRHPSIVDACAVSLPQLDCTELPVFALQRRNGDKVDTQEVAELLRSEYFLQYILYFESIISKTHSYTYEQDDRSCEQS